MISLYLIFKKWYDFKTRCFGTHFFHPSIFYAFRKSIYKYKRNHDNFIPVTGATCIFFISLAYHTLLTKKLWVDKTTNYTSPQLSVTIFYTGIFWLEKSYLVLLCWSVWNETSVKIFANSLWMQLFTYVNARDFGPNHLLLWCKYKSLDGYCLQ